MRHRLRRLLVLSALALWCVTAACSIRARRATDTLAVELPWPLCTRPDTPESRRNGTSLGITNSRGGFEFWWLPSDGRGAFFHHQRHLPRKDPAYIGWHTTFQAPGVRRIADGLWGGNRITVEHWLVSIVTLLSPCAALVALTRRRLRRQAGCCPACGYDTRVTPHRCPECGPSINVNR